MTQEIVFVWHYRHKSIILAKLHKVMYKESYFILVICTHFPLNFQYLQFVFCMQVKLYLKLTFVDKFLFDWTTFPIWCFKMQWNWEHNIDSKNWLRKNWLHRWQVQLIKACTCMHVQNCKMTKRQNSKYYIRDQEDLTFSLTRQHTSAHIQCPG